MTLQLSSVQFAYRDKQIIDHLTFVVAEPKIIGLVAPNGTGKSTLIDLIAGNLSPQVGAITFKGHKATDNLVQWKRQVVKMPDQADLYGRLSGIEHLTCFASLWGIPRETVSQVVQRLRMDSYCHQRVNSYSLGMKQRLCFALALVTQAPILLLDEVMNGLDPDNVALISQVLRDVRNRGTIIMMASHLLDNLDELADQICFLHQGELAIVHEPQSAVDKVALLLFATPMERQQFALDYQLTDATSDAATQLIVPNGQLLAQPALWQAAHNRCTRVVWGGKTTRMIYRELYPNKP